MTCRVYLWLPVVLTIPVDPGLDWWEWWCHSLVTNESETDHRVFCCRQPKLSVWSVVRKTSTYAVACFIVFYIFYLPFLIPIESVIRGGRRKVRLVLLICVSFASVLLMFNQYYVIINLKA